MHTDYSKRYKVMMRDYYKFTDFIPLNGLLLYLTIAVHVPWEQCVPAMVTILQAILQYNAVGNCIVEGEIA